MKPLYFLSLALLLILPARAALADCSMADQKDISKEAAVAFVKDEFPNAKAGIWYFNFVASSSGNEVNEVLVHLLDGPQISRLIQVRIGSDCKILSAEANPNLALWNYLADLEKQKNL